MNFCTTFSESHRVFFEKHFLKSFPFSSDVSLVAEVMPQACKTGHLFADGWRDQMILKEEFIFNCLNKFKGELCVFCDADIRFYEGETKLSNDLVSCLAANDICFMKDHADSKHGYGAGFFVVRSTPKMIDFFSEVLGRLYDLSVREKGESVTFNTSEQGTVNDLLAERKDKILYDFLPERYYSHGKYTNGIKNTKNPNGQWWEQKDEEEKANVFIPRSLLVHHANWCCGVSNKLHLLEFIKLRTNTKKGGRECLRDLAGKK